MEFIFTLEPESKIPYYHQLYQFVRQEIESGRIATGTRLPSVRSLSDSLKISKTTVEQAYQQLMAEGYIGSRHRSGYFSLPPEHGFTHPENPQSHELLLNVSEEAKIDIDFHPARVDAKNFPSTILKKITNEVWNEFDYTMLDYGDAQGELGLRRQIAVYLRDSRGVNCNPQQIVVGSGLQYSLDLLVQFFEMDNGQVAIEEPGYDRARFVFERLHVNVDPIPLESDGIDVNRLYDSTAKFVYVTPSHQFPQGMVMSYSKRLKLLEWAQRCGTFIVEDDYDGEFRYSERPIPALQGLDRHQRVVYIGTFSKALAPSFRLNYMVLPAPLVDLSLAQLQGIDSPVSKLQQCIVERFMELGHFERHIRRTRRTYRQRHTALLKAIRSEFGEYAEITGHGAGLHVLIRLQTPYSEPELAERAKSVGVKVYFESRVQPLERRQTVSIVLGFASLDVAEIAEGVRRLSCCWL